MLDAWTSQLPNYARIDAHRKQAHALSVAQLLKDGSPPENSPDLVLTIDPEVYPAPVSSLHKGMHPFKKPTPQMSVT